MTWVPTSPWVQAIAAVITIFGALLALLRKIQSLAVVRGPAVPLLYIEMDGTGIPVVEAETEGRAGKVDGQPAYTREVKWGCVFTQTTTDPEGRPVRDEDSTSYVAAIETAEAFGLRLIPKPGGVAGLGRRRRW